MLLKEQGDGLRRGYSKKMVEDESQRNKICVFLGGGVGADFVFLGGGGCNQAYCSRVKKH